MVCVSSYDQSHYKQIIQALNNNKHVFVEKPMCLKKNEARRIRDTLKKKPNLRISSNMVLRTCPLFNKTRKLVKEGKMGDIYYLEADYLWGRKEKLISGWRAKADFYSIINGAAIHMIDLAIWIIGKKPVTVQALGNNISTRGGLLKYNDFATLLLEFKNKMVIKISAHGGCVHPHFHTLKVFGKNSSFIHELTGTTRIKSNKLNIKFESDNKGYPAKTERRKILSSFLNSFYKKNVSAIVSDEDVFVTSSICLAAEQAVKTGQKINIEYL